MIFSPPMCQCGNMIGVFGFFTKAVLILHNFASRSIAFCPSISSSLQAAESKADWLFSLHALFGLFTYLLGTPVSICRPWSLLRKHKDLVLSRVTPSIGIRFASGKNASFFVAYFRG